MRFFELILLTAVGLHLAFACASSSPSPELKMLALVSTFLMGVHLVHEGSRWQLLPGYAAVLLTLLLVTVPGLGRIGPLLGVVGLLMVALAATMATVLPVFRFPEPTGPLRIGSTVLHLVDRDREEVLGGPPGARRELLIQVWYPTDEDAPGQPFFLPSETTWRNSRLARVRTHAAKDVSVSRAQSRYPVLIFSPAWTGRRHHNTFQAENLASHGYIVVGIDHPYGADRIIFPDGRIATGPTQQWLELGSDEAFDSSYRHALDQLRVRTGDVRFVLDTLQALDRRDPEGLLTGRIDFTRVGVFGHSFGGAVATEAARSDPRIRACLNMDGAILGEAAENGIEQPFLYMIEDEDPPTTAEVSAATGVRKRYLELVVRIMNDLHRSFEEHGGAFLQLRGAAHMNFCDSPLYSPLKSRTEAGPIAVPRAMETINAYTLAFFDRHLRSGETPLLDGPSRRYPEVELKTWPRLAEIGESTR